MSSPLQSYAESCRRVWLPLHAAASEPGASAEVIAAEWLAYCAWQTAIAAAKRPATA